LRSSETITLLDAFEAVPDVLEEISPEDTMWEGSRDHYFESSRSALKCVRQGMLAAQIAGFKNILDFPSGLGAGATDARGRIPRRPPDSL
jgi:hypothetical protein